LTRGDVVVVPLDDQHAVTSRPRHGAGLRWQAILQGRTDRCAAHGNAAAVRLPAPVAHRPRDLILTAMPDHFVVGLAQPGRRADRPTDRADVRRGEGPEPGGNCGRGAALGRPADEGVRGRRDAAARTRRLLRRTCRPPDRARHCCRVEGARTRRGRLRPSPSAPRCPAPPSRDRFATLVGKPPLEVLTAWRMQLAWRMLDHHHESVAAVATKVGYGAEAAFRKAFKRYFGIGPGEVPRP
jgi:hypothetical protein